MNEITNEKHIVISDDEIILSKINLPDFINENEIKNNPAMLYLIRLSSKKSRQSMGSYISTVAKFLGNYSIQSCPWSELRQHHVITLMESLSDKKKGPATIKANLSALKGVAKCAWSMKQMDTDSYLQIKEIKPPKGYRLPKGRALRKPEIKQLLFICDSDPSPTGVRDAAIVSILLGCGLRRSEVVMLDIESINNSDHTIKVLGKGNKERIAFIPKGAYRRLHKWISEIRGTISGTLFTRIRRHGDVTYDRLTDQAIYHILSVRAAEAGIEQFAPHDLRRTFATALLDNDEDIVTVRDAMGHASVTTTQIYDRRGLARLRAASERLGIVDDE